MKNIWAVLLVFTLVTGQVCQICRGESFDSVVMEQKDQNKTEKTETNQKDFNEKVLARLIELETKIDKDKERDKEKTPKNVFAKAFMWIKKVSVFIIKKFFWLVAVLSTYTGFSYLFFVRMMENVEKTTKCFESAKDLFEFLEEHQGLAERILDKLFENISGNYGDHKMTSEEKKRINNFAKEILKRFHPDNINRLKNLTKKDLETITKKTNDMLDALGV